MKKFILLMILLFSAISCGSDDDNSNNTVQLTSENEILYFQVNYSDNAFMGGYSIASSNSNPLEVEYDFVEPGDFGSLHIKEVETEITVFDGEIIWLGTGTRSFPESLLSPESFEGVVTADYVTASAYQNIFTEIYEPSQEEMMQAWGSIQYLVLLREKLALDPDLVVHYFLYTPAVGDIDFNEAYWVFYLK